MIVRSILLPIKEANVNKLDLIEEIHYVVSFVTFELIRRFLEGEKVNYSTIKEYSDLGAMRLLNQAWHGFIEVKNSKNEIKNLENLQPPVYLDSKVVRVEASKTSTYFKYWLLVRDFDNKRWVEIPITTYNYAMIEYLENPNWKMKDTILLIKKKNKFYIQLSFEKVAISAYEPEASIGIDVGLNTFVMTSSKALNAILAPFLRLYHRHVKKMLEVKKMHDKTGIKKSKRYRKLIRRRNQLQNLIAKLIVLFARFKKAIVVLEKFNNKLNHNKSGEWSKEINRQIDIYGLRRFQKIIIQKAEVLDVPVLQLSPEYTSQTCPVCGFKFHSNRHGNHFRCGSCGYEGNADFVAAINLASRSGLPVLDREPIVPGGQNPEPAFL